MSQNSNQSGAQILTKTQKLQQLIKVYGGIALGTHIVLSLASLGITYAYVKNGLDTKVILEKVGINMQDDKWKNASDFAIAYIIHKGTMSIRIPITLAVVPLVARLLKKK